jgi:hypothetical protein
VPRELLRLQSTIEASRCSWNATILSRKRWRALWHRTAPAAQHCGQLWTGSKYTRCTNRCGCCVSATAHKWRRLSGTPSTAASRPSAPSQLPAPSWRIPCRTSSFTTLTRNKGLPAVRWRNDPGEIIWQSSLSKALRQIGCHTRLRQTSQRKLYTLALGAQSPGRTVRGFVVHFHPAVRIDTSRGALRGSESSG